ncbi:basic salivary proline-rich protein 2-like [Eublepharis macularius]|uniref:Basic salivary proline-rich protein 2-like n=1 Tax=Eublepharis macularius TaxID=481883 RepID=A0AA97LA01_EUBMA|nr:basic salivary proline-rich protein 2-like [Eublepharis macularius]
MVGAAGRTAASGASGGERSSAGSGVEPGLTSEGSSDLGSNRERGVGRGRLRDRRSLYFRPPLRAACICAAFMEGGMSGRLFESEAAPPVPAPPARGKPEFRGKPSTGSGENPGDFPPVPRPPSTPAPPRRGLFWGGAPRKPGLAPCGRTRKAVPSRLPAAPPAQPRLRAGRPPAQQRPDSTLSAAAPAPHGARAAPGAPSGAPSERRGALREGCPVLLRPAPGEAPSGERAGGAPRERAAAKPQKAAPERGAAPPRRAAQSPCPFLPGGQTGPDAAQRCSGKGAGLWEGTCLRIAPLGPPSGLASACKGSAAPPAPARRVRLSGGLLSPDRIPRRRAPSARGAQARVRGCEASFAPAPGKHKLGSAWYGAAGARPLHGALPKLRGPLPSCFLRASRGGGTECEEGLEIRLERDAEPRLPPPPLRRDRPASFREPGRAGGGSLRRVALAAPPTSRGCPEAPTEKGERDTPQPRPLAKAPRSLSTPTRPKKFAQPRTFAARRSRRARKRFPLTRVFARPSHVRALPAKPLFSPSGLWPQLPTAPRQPESAPSAAAPPARPQHPYDNCKRPAGAGERARRPEALPPAGRRRAVTAALPSPPPAPPARPARRAPKLCSSLRGPRLATYSAAAAVPSLRAAGARLHPPPKGRRRRALSRGAAQKKAARGREDAPSRGMGSGRRRRRAGGRRAQRRQRQPASPPLPLRAGAERGAMCLC